MQGFKVQLIQKTEKKIPQKAGKEITFVVMKFLEYNEKTGVPTGEIQDKYLRLDSEILRSTKFEFGAFFIVELNFSGKITAIREFKK